MPTTDRNENRCGIAASIAPTAFPPIVRHHPSAGVVRRKRVARQPPIASFSFTGMNHRAKWYGALAGTPAYERSRRARYKIEALFAEIKQRMSLQRVRLRTLWNVSEQFLLAATAQNLKRLVRFLAQRPPTLETQLG
jgi:hypothetical protein